MIETRFRGLLDQFQVEIGVLKALDHPNIIHLADVFETETRIYMVRFGGHNKNGEEGYRSCMTHHHHHPTPPHTHSTSPTPHPHPPTHQVMELMRGGELFDYVVEKGTLSEEEVCLSFHIYPYPKPARPSFIRPRPTLGFTYHIHGRTLFNRPSPISPLTSLLYLLGVGPGAAPRLGHRVHALDGDHPPRPQARCVHAWVFVVGGRRCEACGGPRSERARTHTHTHTQSNTLQAGTRTLTPK
jgi:hypothetical protein